MITNDTYDNDKAGMMVVAGGGYGSTSCLRSTPPRYLLWGWVAVEDVFGIVCGQFRIEGVGLMVLGFRFDH